ncbi:hypothetical protein DL768_006884 [Monosporascus sp. mg162]|nr:hypothetical protein DL768_006884 [Monosporascus sp. mg162]
MLVTDADKREHYQIVTHYDRVMLRYDAIGPKFGTSAHPTALQIPSSGVDARSTPDLAHDDWKCFEGRRGAVASDVRYGRGRYPNLPDPVAAG